MPKNDDASAALGIAVIVVLAVVLVAVAGLALAWALHTLAPGVVPPVSWGTFFATLVVAGVLGGSSARR